MTAYSIINLTFTRNILLVNVHLIHLCCWTRQGKTMVVCTLFKVAYSPTEQIILKPNSSLEKYYQKYFKKILCTICWAAYVMTLHLINFNIILFFEILMPFPTHTLLGSTRRGKHSNYTQKFHLPSKGKVK